MIYLFTINAILLYSYIKHYAFEDADRQFWEKSTISDYIYYIIIIRFILNFKKSFSSA